MRLGKPLFVLGQRGITGLCQAITQSVVQMHQLASHRWFLRPRRDHAGASTALPSFDDVGHAHAQPIGHRPSRKMVQRKNPIAQILRISLTTMPTHQSLRLQPKIYESHQFASLKQQNSIPPLREPL